MFTIFHNTHALCVFQNHDALSDSQRQADTVQTRENKARKTEKKPEINWEQVAKENQFLSINDVKKFQEKHQLTVDGKVGRETLAALKALHYAMTDEQKVAEGKAAGERIKVATKIAQKESWNETMHLHDKMTSRQEEIKTAAIAAEKEAIKVALQKMSDIEIVRMENQARREEEIRQAKIESGKNARARLLAQGINPDTI